MRAFYSTLLVNFSLVIIIASKWVLYILSKFRKSAYNRYTFKNNFKNILLRNVYMKNYMKNKNNKNITSFRKVLSLSRDR